MKIDINKQTIDASVRLTKRFGNFVEDVVTGAERNNNKANIRNLPPVINNTVRKFTKSEVRAALKTYTKNNRNKCIDPSELDRILSQNSRRNGIKDAFFYPRADMPQGRIRKYELTDGTRYVLEVHTNEKGEVITRLYEDVKTVSDYFGNYKNERLYLCNDGKFRSNAYMSKESHLKTTELGLDWINAA